MSQPNFYSQPPNQSGISDSYAQNTYGQNLHVQDSYDQDSFGQAYYDPSTAAAAVPAGIADTVETGQFLMSLGRIQITSTQVITPSGTIPIGQAQFCFIDRTVRTKKTPTWAIVLALAGFFILTVFSLLFLLVKEETPSGTAVIQVSGCGVHHQEHVQVTDQAQLQALFAQVQQAQQMVIQSMR